MTKQEEIRKGIAKLTEDRFRSPAESAGLTWDTNFNYILAGDILSYLHSQGVVIKVDRDKVYDKNCIRKILDLTIREGSGITESEIVDFYDRAGYVAVEPLIKEG